jgi:hypothetical protein
MDPWRELTMHTSVGNNRGAARPRWTSRLLCVLSALALVACTASTESQDGTGEEEAENVASAEELLQGGCSQIQIESRQRTCVSECASRGGSRGISYCKLAPGTIFGIDAPCVCKRDCAGTMGSGAWVKDRKLCRSCKVSGQSKTAAGFWRCL